MITPSGRIIRCHWINARFCPVARSALYSPINRLPRPISTRVPSKPNTSREMIARYVADLENALELLGKGSVKVSGRVISDDVKRPAIVFRPPGSR